MGKAINVILSTGSASSVPRNLRAAGHLLSEKKSGLLLTGEGACFLESHSSSQHEKPFRKGKRLPNCALAFSFVRLSYIS